MTHEGADIVVRILAFVFGVAFFVNLIYARKRLAEVANMKAALLKKSSTSEVDIARRVFLPDFKSRRAELKEFIEMVEEVFGADIAKNTREIYWIRMALHTIEEERQWLAQIGGISQPETGAA